MFETPITVVGTIATSLDRRWVGNQELIKFRVASNSRRRTPDGTWESGNSLYATVNCWGRLVTGVGAGFCKGDAVIVVGYLYTSEYEDRDGNRRSSLEIRATSVGPDVARCIARIDKRRHPEPATEAASAASATEAPSADSAPETPPVVPATEAPSADSVADGGIDRAAESITDDEELSLTA